MRPAIVLAVHDPDGVMFPHLRAVTVPLKAIFGRGFVSITQLTREAQEAHTRWLDDEPFYQVCPTPVRAPIGVQFRALYKCAAASCAPEQVLHLCFPDRVAYALRTDHRDQFIADVHAAEGATPLLYQRSDAAWRTHPRNYREIEGCATRVGELMLKRRLDLAWCHLALRARQLAEALPYVRNSDPSMLAEVLLELDGEVHTRDVDWLAWEDPFILGVDAGALRAERENSAAEAGKRLAYVISILRLLAERLSGPEASGE